MRRIFLNRKINKVSLIILIYSFITQIAFSQSDTPCGSTPMVLGTECNYITHDASGNNLGPDGGTPTCGYIGSSIVYEDTWYSFVAPSSGNANIELGAVAGSAYNYAGLAIYSGTCTTLTEIDCGHNYGGSIMPHSELTGLTPGATYFVRVWGIYISSSNSGNPRTIDYCAFEPATPPLNDECLDALPAAVNSDAYCESSTSGTIEGATESYQSNWCSGNANDDVWFTFVAENTTHYFNLENVSGSSTDLSYQVFSGTCGSLSNATCNSGVSNSLIIGNTYFVRIWSLGSTGENTTFDLCITSPPVQPDCAVNDPAGNTACTATPICNLDGYCGTTASSYSSDSWTELESAFSCGTLENNSFLSFVAIETTISFWVWVTSTTNANGIQIMVFSANSCGSGAVTSYECWSPGNVSVAPVLVSAAGLTIGDEYYIMIDGNAGDVADYVIGAHEGIQIPIDVTSDIDVTNICLGDEVDLIANGGTGNYTWTPGTYLNMTNNDTVTAIPTAIGSTTYTVTSTVINPLCPSTDDEVTLIVSDCLLPIELINFNVECENNLTVLNWSTSSETNNQHFIIERSSNGEDYEIIEQILGAGNSNQQIDYSYIDQSSTNTQCYYRLSQVDYNGTINNLDVKSNIRICNEKLDQPTIYPNPTNNEITINFSLKNGSEYSIELYNSIGQLTHQEQSSNTNNSDTKTVNINLNDYSDGMYLVRIVIDEKIYTQKLIKE